jgi:large subunit ribosomal protein L9
MKVLLTKNTKGMGQAGDMVEVSDGYARNYLFPRHLAVQAIAGAVRMSEQMKKKNDIREAAMDSRAREISSKLKGLVCTLKAPADDNGRLYGSITEKDIAAAVAQAGVALSHRQISLDEHIKTTGEHPVQVRVAGEQFESITVRVVAD